MPMVTTSGFYDGKFLKAGQSRAAPSEDAAPDLAAMTKDELLAEAKRRGVKVASSDTKAEIVAAIDAA